MNLHQNHPMSRDELRLVVVQDEPQDCPYINGTTARMPLSMPIGQVSATFVDTFLAQGYRRSGGFLYRTQCPGCRQCQPTRVVVSQFRLTRSLRRVLNRGDRELTCHWDEPIINAQRVALFNRHRVVRQLDRDSADVDAQSYHDFLISSCCDTRELSVYRHDRLIATAIFDVGRTAISAVYTYFDPDEGRYSLGTYCILKQFQWVSDHQREYCYLGMYVAENPHLNYKARFVPQQRLIDGIWQPIDSAS